MEANHGSKLTDPKEVVKEFYSALNGNDIPTAALLFDPHAVRVEFEGSPSGGTFRGNTEIHAHLIKGRETWADGGCYPEQFIVEGEKVVVLVHVRVMLKTGTLAEGRTADGFTVRNGKILEFYSFFEKEKALRWAGMDPQN